MHHRIVITADPGLSRIEPPHSIVARGDTVDFSVQGSEYAELFFPRPGLFSSGVDKISLQEKNPPHREIIGSEAMIGSYPFSAYCRTQNRFAKGGSDGEIIIQT